ncbi:MAG: sigma-54 dependent transcriptional regulator [Planctomycetaceae bacterium]|jgi:two-component system NtrC family response regulator|nr:sigma-54 dependent transcriptional regulator [Planctomycetaceae bacterium]
MTTKTNLPSPESLSILFADDEKELQEIARLELPFYGHRVTVCPDGYTAVAALEKEQFDCLIVDLDMPGMNGIQVIERASVLSPATEAIVLTGKRSLETAVAALRFGVIDYLSKPCRFSELSELLQRVAQRRKLKQRTAELQRLERSKSSGTTQIIGESKAMQGIAKLVSRVAPTNSTVLIRGETGCGKELVARSVHEKSLRCDKPFIAINCGALPEHLIESELFGHVKGAFTGADVQRQGLFEAANGGTVFLDEIGELPLAMQAKLLRVLESGDLRRVGDNQIIHVDTRVVCATHRDLESMVESGSFREDLLFRINAFEIHVPPLRQRVEDVMSLAKYLYLRHHPEHASLESIFSPEAIELLLQHPWPGNVRELANVIEHATILCEYPPILPEHLPRHLVERKLRRDIKVATDQPAVQPLREMPKSLKELEVLAVQEAVQRHNGNKAAAAEELGISIKTLYNKLNSAEANIKRVA